MLAIVLSPKPKPNKTLATTLTLPTHHYHSLTLSTHTHKKKPLARSLKVERLSYILSCTRRVMENKILVYPLVISRVRRA